jgi:hypothetical protein
MPARDATGKRAGRYGPTRRRKLRNDHKPESRGEPPKANEYTLGAAAVGGVQQITVDGASAAVSDTTFSATEFIDLGISDASAQGGAAIFSNFTFTPLPASARLSPSVAASPVTS